MASFWKIFQTSLYHFFKTFKDLTAKILLGELYTFLHLKQFLSLCCPKIKIMSNNIMKTSKYTKILALNLNLLSKILDKKFLQIFQNEVAN